MEHSCELIEGKRLALAVTIGNGESPGALNDDGKLTVKFLQSERRSR
jgi:hypothetical protein